jgi:hypothetical protein
LTAEAFSDFLEGVDASQKNVRREWRNEHYLDTVML